MEAALAYQEEYRACEMIDGEVYMMARPSYEHMRVEGNIFGLFDRYLRGKKCRPAFEMDVYLSDEDHVIPDVLILCNIELLKDGRINGAPDLVVAILSPSTARADKFRKRALYEKYGVKEYWIVDPIGKTIEVYHLVESKYELNKVCILKQEQMWVRLNEEEKAAIEEQQRIKVSLYEDFMVEVAEVFRDVD